MHDVHKQQGRCNTFGWNPIVRLLFVCKVFLEAYEYVINSAYRIPCISIQGSKEEGAPEEDPSCVGKMEWWRMWQGWDVETGKWSP
jgi:hypothetical protein